MADLINKETGVINLAELSKHNGKTEFENLKMIVEILSVKAEVYDIPQTVQITFKR